MSLRKKLIRVAATLPKGSEERTALLQILAEEHPQDPEAVALPMLRKILVEFMRSADKFPDLNRFKVSEMGHVETRNFEGKRVWCLDLWGEDVDGYGWYPIRVRFDPHGIGLYSGVLIGLDPEPRPGKVQVAREPHIEEGVKGGSPRDFVQTARQVMFQVAQRNLSRRG